MVGKSELNKRFRIRISASVPSRVSENRDAWKVRDRSLLVDLKQAGYITSTVGSHDVQRCCVSVELLPVVDERRVI